MITYKVVYFEKEYLDNAVQQIDNSTEEIFTDKKRFAIDFTVQRK